MSDFRTEDYRLTNPSKAEADYARDANPYTPSMSGVASFLSSTEREGHWQLPRHFRALAVMGNVELDLRAAEIGYGLSVIEAVTFMGNIEITIPPHIAVECDGDSLLGTFTLKYDGRTSPGQASGDRVIRVTGTAYMGAVTVAVKGPNERMLKRLARTLGVESE